MGPLFLLPLVSFRYTYFPEAVLSNAVRYSTALLFLLTFTSPLPSQSLLVFYFRVRSLSLPSALFSVLSSAFLILLVEFFGSIISVWFFL